jgi:6,7-dimethyl-8-ribityllumazine synthase
VSPRRFAIVVSRFNAEITQGLLRGATGFLREASCPVEDKDILTAPGAFELPLLAQQLAQTGRYSGVVCLGCVIKGETAHFEFISLGATIGLVQASLNTETPIAFGIVTTYTEEQALARSRDDAENKGREAARACLESADLLARIAELD